MLREEEEEKEEAREREREREREIVLVKSSACQRENGTNGENSGKRPPRTQNLAKTEGRNVFFFSPGAGKSMRAEDEKQRN